MDVLPEDGHHGGTDDGPAGNAETNGEQPDAGFAERCPIDGVDLNGPEHDHRHVVDPGRQAEEADDPEETRVLDQ